MGAAPSGLVFEKVCGTPHADMCMSPFGHCELEAQTWSCVCNEGFEHDRIMFRMENCAQPKGLFLSVHVINLFFGVCACLMLFVRLPKLKGSVKLLVQLFALSALLLSISDIIALIQGYPSIGFWIGLGAFFFVQPLSFARTLWLFFDVSYKTLDTTMTSRRTIMGTLVAFYLVTALPLGVVFPLIVISLGDGASPDYNVNLYNTAQGWIMALFPVHLFISLPLGIYVTHDLKRRVRGALQNVNQDGRGLERFREVRTKLIQFRVVNTSTLPLVEVLLFTVGFGVSYFQKWPVLAFFSFINLLTANLTMLTHIYITAPAPAVSSAVMRQGNLLMFGTGSAKSTSDAQGKSSTDAPGRRDTAVQAVSASNEE